MSATTPPAAVGRSEAAATATKTLAVRGLMAAGAAAVANTAVQLLSLAALDVPSDFEPLRTPAPATSSIMVAIAATAVAIGCQRLTRRPVTIFTAIAAVVFVLSFGPLISLAQSDGAGSASSGAQIAALAVMHLIEATIVVGTLVRTLRSFEGTTTE